VVSMLDFAFWQARRQGSAIVVETHSEHILRKSLNYLRSGIYPSGQVSICLVERNAGGQINGAKVKSVEIDDQGNVKNFPTEFFGVSAAISAESIDILHGRNGDEG